MLSYLFLTSGRCPLHRYSGTQYTGTLGKGTWHLSAHLCIRSWLAFSLHPSQGMPSDAGSKDKRYSSAFQGHLILGGNEDNQLHKVVENLNSATENRHTF